MSSLSLIKSYRRCYHLRNHISYFSSHNKVSSIEDAINLVNNNNTISVGGFVAQGAPETLLRALGQRYCDTGQPKNLKLVFGGGEGCCSVNDDCLLLLLSIKYSLLLCIL